MHVPDYKLLSTCLGLLLAGTACDPEATPDGSDDRKHGVGPAEGPDEPDESTTGPEAEPPGEPGEPLEGCTRTRGYWQTHHAEGVASRQPWPISEQTELCGSTWIDLLWTPPGGDPWAILAAQWIAASLNVESGAEPSAEVSTALAEGGAILASCEVSDAALTLALADLLDRFNNGLEGEEHCDDAGGTGGDDDGGDGDTGDSAGESDGGAGTDSAGTGGECVPDPDGVIPCDGTVFPGVG